MLDYTAAKRMIDSFPTRCRAAGLKVTPQRMAVYAMLAKTEAHPSAEDVYSHIRMQIPAISLGTVYKILEILEENGFAKKVATQRQTARFDAKVETHHHAECRKCGAIQDLPDLPLPTEMQERLNLMGFTPESHEIVFHGVCQKCQPHA